MHAGRAAEVPNNPNPTPSLWDKRKNRTRQALHRAALELFAEHGYEGTTIDMIVERADVSPRTFFRYFPTKDSVYLFSEREWMQSFTEAFRAQPEAMSDLEALRTTLVALAPQTPRHSLVLNERAVTSSPTLRGLAQAQLQEDTQIIATSVATRRGLRRSDDMSRLMAEIAVLAYRRALDAWLAQTAHPDLSRLVANEFDLLAQLFKEEQAHQERRNGIASLNQATRGTSRGGKRAG